MVTGNDNRHFIRAITSAFSFCNRKVTWYRAIIVHYHGIMLQNVWINTNFILQFKEIYCI